MFSDCRNYTVTGMEWHVENESAFSGYRKGTCSTLDERFPVILKKPIFYSLIWGTETDLLGKQKYINK